MKNSTKCRGKMQSQCIYTQIPASCVFQLRMLCSDFSDVTIHRISLLSKLVQQRKLESGDVALFPCFCLLKVLCIPPQGLCTCSSFCWECSFLRYAHGLSLFHLFDRLNNDPQWCPCPNLQNLCICYLPWHKGLIPYMTPHGWVQYNQKGPYKCQKETGECQDLREIWRCYSAGFKVRGTGPQLRNALNL